MNGRPLSAGLVALALPVALAAIGTAGQSARVALQYRVDPSIEGCPEEQGVRDTLAAKLGYDPFVEPAEHRATLKVVPRGAGIVGILELEGPRKGRREIDSSRSDCREVVDALVMAAAIAIDPAVIVRPPSSTSSSQPPPSAPPPSSSAPPPQPPPSQPPIERPPPPDPRPTYAILAGATFLVGELPSSAAALEAGGRIRFGWGSVAMTVMGSTTAETDRVGPGAGHVDLMALNLLPCGHAGSWSGCLVGSFGRLRAKGEDVDLPKQVIRRTGAAGAMVAYDWVPTRDSFLAVGVTGGVLVPLTRTSMYVDGEEVWTTPSIAGRIGGRLSLCF